MPTRRPVALVVLSLCLTVVQIAQPQVQGCPNVPQLLSSNGSGPDRGMANNASVNVVLANNGDSSSTWSPDTTPGSQIDQISQAVIPWTTIPGSGQNYSVNTYGSPVNVSQMLSAGTELNPTVIVVHDTNATAASECGGAPSCEQDFEDDNNVTTGSIIWVADAVFNGTMAQDFPDYPSNTLTDVVSHEFGVHADEGWSNCTDGNCDMTAAGPPAGPPTDCDIQHAQQCGR